VPCQQAPDEALEHGAEPVGSCDNCGCDIYPGEGDDGLCDQCEWYLDQADLERRETGED
jgi:hypothetical protein